MTSLASLGRWIACAALVAACGGGKAAPRPPPVTGVDAGVVEEADEPDEPEPVEAQLDVSGIQPTFGEAGTEVRIIGTAFTVDDRSITVYFGAKKAEVVNVTDTEITVTAPKASAGDVVDISVKFEPGGELRLPDAFSYPDED